MADKTSKSSDIQLLSKKASFVQHSLPGLEVGTYQLNVQQSFFDSDKNPINEEELLKVTKVFAVQAPKYSIPQEAISTQYPPIAAAGGFSNSIAHVVLNKEKLPWIRTPYLPKNEPEIKQHHYKTKYDGNMHNVTYDDDKPTWLAVLLISPSDIGGANPKTLITKGTAKDLIPSQFKIKNGDSDTVQGTMPTTAYSIFSYTLESGHAPKNNTVDPGVGHTADEACVYIDIPVAVFNKIAPSITDLQMMAHVRSVEMDTKPINDGQTVEPTETYSLVVGNRLPETMPKTEYPPADQTRPAQGSNLALLVSLENMENALRGYPNSGYYGTNIAEGAHGTVRLPVFFKWEFVSWQDSAYDFEHILKGLNGRDANAANSGPLVNKPLFRNPNPPSYDTPTQAQILVQDMIELGYSPMNHVTRVPYVDGSNNDPIQMVSWYRGPLAPFPVAKKVGLLTGNVNNSEDQTPLIYAADQLLRFDPKAGMYDTSYAAAWQIGQLIALQDQSFSTELYRFKQTTEWSYRMVLENAVMQNNFTDLMAAFSASDDQEPLTNKPLYECTINFLINPDKS